MTLKQTKELTPEPQKPQEPTEPLEPKEVKAKETPEAEKGKEGTTPDILKRVEGKSPEELGQIIADQEKMIGDQSTTINTQKEDLSRYESQVQQTPQATPQGRYQPPYGQGYDPNMGYPGYQPQPYNPYPQPGTGYPGAQPQVPQPPPIDFTNPDQSIEQKIQWYQNQADQKRQYEDKVRYGQDLKGAYDEGRSRTFKSKPKLFKGIEKEVEDGVKAMVGRGMFSPADLRREDTWELAGMAARFKRGEFSYLQPETPPAMTAPHSETPASMKEETLVPVELSDVEKDTQKWSGLTDEEVREELKKTGRTK